MSDQPVFEAIRKYRVVPVIAIEAVEQALPLADALIEGGLPIAEITFRTEAAAEVLRLLSAERPQLVLGAGTVLTTETLHEAAGCGAGFVVAPGFNRRVVSAAADIGLPVIPGVATPSDIESAMEQGIRILKFFPAQALGGTKYLSAIYAPYRHTGVKFVPTGGVSETNLADYLALDCVAAVGGTWIAKKQDIAAGNFDTIADRCREVHEIVSQIDR